MKILFSILMLAAIVGSNGVANAQYIKFSDGEGNNGSGGGNTTPDYPATDEQIRKAIQNLPTGMHYVFTLSARSVHKSYPIAPNEKAHYYLSKEGQAEFLNLSKKVRVDVLTNRPCVAVINGKKVPSEGSSNIKNNSICLSISEIQKAGRSAQNINTKVLGLFIHELLEVNQVPHEVALYYQRKIEDSVGQLDYYELAQKRAKVREALSALRANIVSTRQDYDQMKKLIPPADMCYIQGLFRENADIDTMPAKFLSRSAQNHQAVIQAVSRNTEYACLSRTLNRSYDYAFQVNGKRAKAVDYRRLRCGQDIGVTSDKEAASNPNYKPCLEYPGQRIVIGYIPYLDFNAVAREWARALPSIDAIEAELKAVPKTTYEANSYLD